MKPKQKQFEGLSHTWRWLAVVALAVAALCMALVVGPARSVPRAVADSTLEALVRQAPDQMSPMPVGSMNLLCASGLGEPEPAAIELSERCIREWAEQVRRETERHRYRFVRNPGDFEYSEGFFRMLMLAVVLAEDFRVHYDPQRRAGPGSSRLDDGFFSEPSKVFISGLLGPERAGTCSSIPVLYVAIGRELGYPLKLVTTKGHLFVRWEGLGERFNIETTGRGLNRYADDYYRHWPFAITPQEEAAEGYLKSLSPAEELAVFLSIRGMCLRESGRVAEAADCFAHAACLAPGCQGYRRMRAYLQQTFEPQKGAASLPQHRIATNNKSP